MDYDGSSSIYSTNSSQNAMPRVARAGTNTSSRPNSYTPSYMSSVQTRSPDTSVDHNRTSSNSYRYHERIPSQIALKIPRRPVTATVKTPSPAQEKQEPVGLLLVVFAAAPHPSTTYFLETLLAKRSFAGIAVVGSKEQEGAIKQLKIDIYSLIGRMHKEVGVHTYLRETWVEADIAAVVQEAAKDSAASGLDGVICSPELDDSGTTDVDVISLSEDALHSSWKQSVGLVHMLSKVTLAQLQTRAATLTSAVISTAASQAPFFLVAGSSAFTAAAQITKPACDTLISLLEKKFQTKGVIVGYADDVLTQERSASLHSEKSLSTNDNGYIQPGYSTSTITYNQSDFTAPESPTKLWNMWAIQNDD